MEVNAVSTSLLNKIERMLKQMLKSFARPFILQCEKAKERAALRVGHYHVEYKKEEI